MTNENATTVSTTEQDSTQMFEHDCGACKFLGTTNVGKRPADLYFHPGPGTTVIARYGKDGDYISGLELISHEPTLAVAAERALRMF